MTAVLFTCAGQRVDIVTAFGRAGATTIAADADPLAPALYHADHHALVPRSTTPATSPALAALVAEHDVRLIVPLTDLDQVLLAEAATSSTPRSCCFPTRTSCRRRSGDKYLAHELFVATRHPVSPPSWLPGDVPADARYPLLVKVREGFGSRHIYRADDRSSSTFFLRYTPVESFVQQVCLGEEFSVDVFCDIDGRCLNAIPRTMIESKGGESIKGMTIKDWELIEHGRRVAEALGIVGPANIQCFREADGSLPVTDVNPRFGGAFPLPLAAGSRYPELALALGSRRAPGAARRRVPRGRVHDALLLPPEPDGER